MLDKQMAITEKKYLNIISMMFITCLLTSNLAAIKICDFWGANLPCGILLFPLLYVLNDILTEVYGFSASRKVVWTALACNLALSSYLYIATHFKPSGHSNNYEAFEIVFSLSPKIFIASMISYLIGELINAVIISQLKIKFEGRMFALRAIFSTAVGSFIESLIFCFIAFSYLLSHIVVLKMALMLTTIKVLYEIVVMPISVMLVRFLKKTEKIDMFENPALKYFRPN